MAQVRALVQENPLVQDDPLAQQKARYRLSEDLVQNKTLS
jgi:hypothetical protein